MYTYIRIKLIEGYFLELEYISHQGIMSIVKLLFVKSFCTSIWAQHIVYFCWNRRNKYLFIHKHHLFFLPKR